MEICKVLDEVCVIILAAGKGSRMKANCAKCACMIDGKPMIKHIVDTLYSLNIKDIITVVGYQKEDIINILGTKVKYAVQEKQLGTANAVMAAKNIVKGNKICIIIPGDMPFISREILKGLISKYVSSNSFLTFISTEMDKELQYGRVIQKDNYYKIKEFKDLSDEEKDIKDLNVGIYAINSDILFDSLKDINNKNKQNEYYLTDMVEKVSKKYKTTVLKIKNCKEITGINDIETLKELENI